MKNTESIMKMHPELNQEDAESVTAELEILLDACQDCNNFQDISLTASTLKNVLPQAYQIIGLILTSPVSSASSERSFSKLNLIMNALRTTMTDDRLNSLLTLFSARDLLDNINISEVVKEWSLLKKRRVSVGSN